MNLPLDPTNNQPLCLYCNKRLASVLGGLQLFCDNGCSAHFVTTGSNHVIREIRFWESGNGKVRLTLDLLNGKTRIEKLYYGEIDPKEPTIIRFERILDITPDNVNETIDKYMMLL